MLPSLPPPSHTPPDDPHMQLIKNMKCIKHPHQAILMWKSFFCRRYRMPFTPSGIKTLVLGWNFSKTKLSMLLKTMMKEANISGNFTNHSLHVTGTTMLFDSGTPEAIIQKCTGSVSALRMYERVTPQQQAIWFPIPLPTAARLQRVNKLIHSIHLDFYIQL